MAYMNQERKAKLAPAIKAILQKYKVKGTLSVRNHSTLVLTLTEGALDFHKDCNCENNYSNIQVNPYWFERDFTGVSRDFLAEVIQAMNNGNHDNSDIQTDYFDVGWYISIDIGKYDRRYMLI